MPNQSAPADNTSPQPEQIWTRKPDVVWSAVDGEAVLLDVASGYYFSLNKVGAIVWDMLDGEKSLGVIRDAICARFSVSPETAWRDISGLIQHLAREKLAIIK